jgi:transposase
LTTKILALVDALGNLVRFTLLPGQRHDSIGAEPILQDIDFDALLADKAFDNNALRLNLNERGAQAIIPSMPQRNPPIPYDPEMYKWRHLVENFFCKLKQFRRIATRYEKTDASFAAMVYAASTVLALR